MGIAAYRTGNLEIARSAFKTMLERFPDVDAGDAAVFELQLEADEASLLLGDIDAREARPLETAEP